MDSLTDPGHFVVEVQVSGSAVQKKIKVVLDGDHGITIEDCARVSRELAPRLDTLEMIENYTLEVSTPGLDQPLKLKRQYKKNIGRLLKIVRKDKTIIKGTLNAVAEDALDLIEERSGNKELKITVIPFDHIDKALVQISFK